MFDSYRFDPAARRIELTYSFDDDLFFTETIALPEGLSGDPDPAELDRALFALHLIAGVSYYKAALPRRMEIRSGALDQRQAEMWNTFYTKGLGEFFYRNSVDFRGLVNFPATAKAAPPAPPAVPRGHTCLVPWGGGKDSVVTVELLREAGRDITLFRLGAHPFITELARVAGLPLMTLERRIDPALFDLNRAGALNGHVPITTYMSFLTVVVALLGGYGGTYFSSERSADFGNIDYLGMQVNHQWSKSLEAEHLIRGYVETYITGSVEYANPLRPLSELAISRIFSEYPQYFDSVTSCNTNWKILDQDPHRQPWCGDCPKCAFVFIMLSAFLPAERLIAMFSKNLYADEALLPLFRELWGGEGFKPFECVGTPDEVIAALLLAQRDAGYAETVVHQAFQNEVSENLPDAKQLISTALRPDWTGVPDQVRALLADRFEQGSARAHS